MVVGGRGIQNYEPKRYHTYIMVPRDCCWSTNRRYAPRLRINSSWDPSSTFSPPSITTILSAPFTVLSLQPSGEGR